MTDVWSQYPAAPSAPDDKWAGFPEVQINRPTGEMRSITPEEAQRGSLRPIDDPSRSASTGTIARASLAPDPQDQIKRFAAARFPELPIELSSRYYGIVNGDIVYADPKDGKIYKEVATIGETPSWTELPSRVAQQVASGAGPAIPATLGSVAGALTAPSGPLTSIGAASAAAGVGDVVRQALDRGLAGESLTREGPLGVPIPDVDYLNSVGQAALSGVGQAAGLAVNRMINRNPLGVEAYERLKAKSPANLAEWQRLQAEAQKRGVDLTAGDVTDLTSLKTTERALRRYPETTDMIGDMVKNRNTAQVPAAVRAELDKIAPALPGGAAEGGAMLRQGADDVVSGLKAARTSAASPYYQRAFASGIEPDISPVLQVVENKMKSVGESTPAGRALKAVYQALTEPQVINTPGGRVTQRAPIKDFEVLHSIKESFDDIVAAAFEGQTSASSRAARQLVDVQSTLRNVLKAAHPDYRDGAAEYARRSIPINDVMRGAIGELKKNDTVAAVRYAEAIFDAAKDIPPGEIAKTRAHFEAAGKLPEWNAGVRSYLVDRLDLAMRNNATGSPGNIPGKFSAAVWGDDRQRQILKAALHDSDRVAGFEKLMEVLQAAARSLPEGSPTSTDAARMAGMDAPAAAARVAGKMFSPGSWLNAGNEVVSAFVAAKRPGDRIKLAEALMSPNALNDLRKLRSLPPTSEKALGITSNILTRAGLLGFTPAGSINQPDDYVPEILGGGPIPRQ